MPRFVAIPELPVSGLLDFQALLFGAVKENVELLSGTRGEADLSSRAIVRGDIQGEVEQLGTQNLVRINTSNSTTPTSFPTSAPLDGFIDLRNDVQTLADDLFRTRETLDLLIARLRG